jgi:hypothetical protein
MSLSVSLLEAIQYADINNIDLPLSLRIRARWVGIIKAGSDLASILSTYYDAITTALADYFRKPTQGPRNAFRRATVDAFGAAFDDGWVDGGAEMPPDGDGLEWFNAQVEREFSFIDTLFVQAKELRKEDEFDAPSWILDRAESYSRAVSWVYNAGKMYALKNKLLTWRLGNTEKHCQTCASLDGQSHRASWYLARNYIPRQPGAAMLCGGYYCDCKLEDKDGNEVTI